MRLRKLKITNFRCYKDEVIIDIDALTVFIGKNDSGKSSLFDACDLFFNRVPEQDDVCVHGDESTIKIACIFDNLPAEIVIDEQHPTNLRAEYLLDQNGMLEIVKTFNCSGSGKVKAANVYARAIHPTADKYNDLLTLTNAKLKQCAKELGVDLSNVNQTINTELRRAIWSHTDALQCQSIDIELKSEAAEKIWEQLKKSLPVFALFKSDRSSTDQDEEAQDPMKSAIKEAIKAQETTLNEIAERVKQEVQTIADRTVEKIREMSPELAKQLKPRVSNKNWDSLFSVSLTGEHDIPINKRGSGTRRLVLLNFFRARAEKDAEGKGTGIIYAIEEPETSQHPNNQKMLVEAFEDLANQDGCQVLLTTHTPMLARRFGQTSLRYLTQENDRTVIHDGHTDETLNEIMISLGVLPDHNIRVFLGIEGRNDIIFLTTISEILNNAGEDVPNLKKAEDDGHLVFVPSEKPKYHAIAEEFGKRANCTVWTTNKKELENYIHPDVIKKNYTHYAGKGEAFENVPVLFAQAVHEASGSDQSWIEVSSNVEKLSKKESSAKRRLCTDYVSRMTPDLLSSIDADNEIRTWLRAIGDALRGC